MSKTAKTISIIPGFGEGGWHNDRLYAALADYGYKRAPQAAIADVVIAHSGGCFFLPNTAKNQLIILIGPPFWPGKNVGLSLLQKTNRDIFACFKRGKVGYWLLKTFWNLIYIAHDLLHAALIAQKASKHNFYEALIEKKAAVIRNRNDAFCTPDIQELLAGKAQFAFYTIEGEATEHDDCWLYTAEHAKLIQTIIQ